jgi:titin
MISGNENAGIEITRGGTQSLVRGNLISENNIGVQIDLASTANTVGGDTPSAGNSIVGNATTGIDIAGTATSRNLVVGNRIAAVGDNGSLGVLIEKGASGNTIGGTVAGSSNAIVGNRDAEVEITGAGSEYNSVLGNSIGPDPSAAQPQGNIGVLIGGGAVANTVGGGNVISNNKDSGVDISGVGTSSNVITGNMIGTDASGAQAIPNRTGVLVERGATLNTIGGTGSGALNLISGNLAVGVDLTGAGTSGNVVIGNLIGTSAAGTGALANQIGVLIEQSASENTIGGSSGGSRNVISGNVGAGVELTGTGTSGNQVAGNDIGINSVGTGSIPNDTGVLISNASLNTLGGAGPAWGNVISANNSDGVVIRGVSSTGNLIAGNKIGTDPSGSRTVLLTSGSGQTVGILITDSVGNTIGGGNLIAGNSTGVELSGFNSSLSGPNMVIGNLIGIDAAGSVVPNEFGVWINDVPNAQIGEPGAGNTISGSTQAGVYISGRDATGNKVQGNAIKGTPVLPPYPVSPSQDPFPIGVYIQDSSSNTIGGTGAGNTISGNNAGIYILGHSGSASGNLIGSNQITGSSLYGVILFNAPANMPESGAGRNTISGSGIADLREYSGPSTRIPSSGGKQPSASRPGAKVARHHRSGSSHHQAKASVSHPRKTIAGKALPAGPARVRLSRSQA